jgi:hypothetical protein
LTSEPLLDRHEYLGEWCSTQDEQKLTGTLTIDGGASELTLVGPFENEPDDRTLYRILGLTTDGVRPASQEHAELSHPLLTRVREEGREGPRSLCHHPPASSGHRDDAPPELEFDCDEVTRSLDRVGRFGEIEQMAAG